MTDPRPLDALRPLPELRLPAGPVQPAGAAYLTAWGGVALVWPPRPGQRPAGTFMRADALDRFDTFAPADCPELCAAFLTADDVDLAASTWRDRENTRANRAARLRSVRAVAADRARERALLLRRLRRGEPPAGSVVVALHPHTIGPRPLVRYPDGRAWWCCGDYLGRPKPWPYDHTTRYWHAQAALRVLALGLSAEECEALAALPQSIEAVEGALRAAGRG